MGAYLRYLSGAEQWCVRVDIWRWLVFGALFFGASVSAWLIGAPGVPVVCVDFLLLTPFLWHWLGRILMLVSVLVALVRSAQAFFGFDQIFVSSYLLFHNLLGFPVYFGAAVVLMVLGGMCALAYITWRLPTRVRSWSLMWVPVCVVLVLGLRQLEDRVRLNIVGTNFGYIFGQIKFAGLFNGAYEIPRRQNENSVTKSEADWAIAHQANLLLILVESMGLPKDPDMAASLMGNFQLAELQAHYRIRTGSTVALGSTIHGELRELCNGHLIDGLFGAGNVHCLPMHMGRHGYNTVAVHANHAKMYGRDQWYPAIGFRQYINADGGELPRGEVGDRWGSLLDGDTIDWVASRISTRKQEFWYLLTVSTHLPASQLPGVSVSKECLAGKGGALCVHHANLQSVMARISKAALRMQNTVIVVVGDHPPPFLTPGSRSMYSQDRVPFMVLEPRGLEGALK